MCKSIRVSSIINSVCHIIILLYHPATLLLIVKIVPQNNPIESIYTRKMYCFDTMSKVCIVLFEMMQKGMSGVPRIAHYLFNFLFSIESGANLAYVLLTRYAKIWYLFFLIKLSYLSSNRDVNKHRYSHCCLKASTSRNPRIFNI